MPRTHDLGPLFAQPLSYPSRRFPLVERGHTQEIEYPYRRGASLVLRLPGTPHAVVLGVWREAHDEEEALYRALSGRALHTEDGVDDESLLFTETAERPYRAGEARIEDVY